MKKPILEVAGVIKRYGSETVLENLSLECYPGDIIGMEGKSGSGKTTLLKCIAGIEPIDVGKIFIDEVDVTNFSSANHRGRIGFVFQDYHLWPHLTILENVIHAPLLVKSFSKEKALQAGRTVLKELDLEGKEHFYPHELSGGQQQRVAIARALVMEPKVLLLDEITSALNPELYPQVAKLIRKLNDEGMTIILVSHNKKFLEKVTNRKVTLKSGKLVEKFASF